MVKLEQVKLILYLEAIVTNSAGIVKAFFITQLKIFSKK
jgi:hypothetical protein